MRPTDVLSVMHLVPEPEVRNRPDRITVECFPAVLLPNIEAAQESITFVAQDDLFAQFHQTLVNWVRR